MFNCLLLKHIFIYNHTKETIPNFLVNLNVALINCSGTLGYAVSNGKNLNPVETELLAILKIKLL